MPVPSQRDEDRLTGILLGTAVGDALGLPCEGLSARVIARRFSPLDRYRFLGRTGYVSDDTEQAALVAQSLLRGRGELEATRRHFRRAMAGWFLRLPWGLGMATLEACLKLCLGFARSGVNSAGNGAAMRAGILGGAIPDAADQRRILGTALAEVTHMDPRAIAGAHFVADLAAACVRQDDRDRDACFTTAFEAVGEPELKARLERVWRHHLTHPEDPHPPAGTGTSGFVLESVPLAAFFFLAEGDPARSLARCIAEGGDTDTNAAMLGAWLGGLHGARGLPEVLVERLQPGPFGRSHLAALGHALATHGPAPSYSRVAALVRNVVLFPVVLAHGFRRLLP